MKPPLHLITEAQIQAEFYRHCVSIGLPCVLEYTTRVGRLDVAIFNSTFTHLLAVVECKNGRVERTNQILRYKRLGVPVYGLGDYDRAERLANQLKRDTADKLGRSIDDLLTIEPKPRRTRERRLRVIELDEDIIFRQ